MRLFINDSNRWKSFDHDERGLETLQIILIFAISALILSMIVRNWGAIGNMATDATDSLMQFGTEDSDFFPGREGGRNVGNDRSGGGPGSGSAGNAGGGNSGGGSGGSGSGRGNSGGGGGGSGDEPNSGGGEPARVGGGSGASEGSDSGSAGGDSSASGNSGGGQRGRTFASGASGGSRNGFQDQGGSAKARKEKDSSSYLSFEIILAVVAGVVLFGIFARSRLQ